MKILAIDYGKKKIGLAVGDTKVGLSEPLKVIRFSDLHSAISDIKKLVNEEKAEKIVVGISDGIIGDEARNFGRLIGRICFLPSEFVDETLTSKDAQAMSIAAGINRKKRRSMEDAYSAALILQSYMDSL